MFLDKQKAMYILITIWEKIHDDNLWIFKMVEPRSSKNNHIISRPNLCIGDHEHPNQSNLPRDIFSLDIFIRG